MTDRHARPVLVSLVLMLLVSALSSVPRETAAQASTAAASADALVFDTWVPGPCSPNGQPQGQCPPGDLFRVRLVVVAEGLKSPRHMAFTPDGDVLITELAEARGAFSVETRALLVAGLLGGFTTFSAFGNETMQLLRSAERWLAAANVLANVVLGLGAVLLGRVAAQLVWR